MPLRFDLGPFEKLFIGKSVITNNGNRSMFVVEGDAPILRARDVLSAEEAVNAVKKLYRCIQQMYLEEDIDKYRKPYVAFLAASISEGLASASALEEVNRLVARRDLYKALQALKITVKSATVDAKPYGSVKRFAAR